jgi:CMP-N,N'-diacetyllegionaminic acid synthase
MAWEGLRVLAVVPARGGSKSIPRKNLAKIAGASLVARAAQMTAALPWLDAAVVSTDDDEIMAEAKAHGLDAPFRRPPDLATDTARSSDMWRHAWLACEVHYDAMFDLSIMLEPTSPLRTAEDVERTVRTLIETKRASAATVSPTTVHYTPHKTLTVDDDGVVGFYLEGGAKYTIRQMIPQFFHRNGVCYATRRETLVDKGHVMEEDCAAVVIDRPVVNIDEPYDLELAEVLLRRERCE